MHRPYCRLVGAKIQEKEKKANHCAGREGAVRGTDLQWTGDRRSTKKSNVDMDEDSDNRIKRIYNMS